MGVFFRAQFQRFRKNTIFVQILYCSMVRNHLFHREKVINNLKNSLFVVYAP